MILEVLLVFSINGAPNEISDRIFESYEECAQFVNEVAQGTVVDSDFSFQFLSVDQLLFEGQCISVEDYWKGKEV